MKISLITILFASFLMAGTCEKEEKQMSNSEIYSCSKIKLNKLENELRKKVNNQALFNKYTKEIEIKAKNASIRVEGGTLEPIIYLKTKIEETEKKIKG